MNCPDCQSQEVMKNGRTKRQDGSVVQKYLCKSCTKQFNDRTGTAMARLRTPSVIVCAALNVRTEGLGIRATGRSLGKSHSTVIRWEQRLEQSSQWSPPAPKGADVTLEGDELYTRVGENLPPRTVPRLDNSLHRTRKPLLGNGTGGEKRDNQVLSKATELLGIGQNQPTTFAGSRMGNDGTGKPCGSLPVCSSKRVKFTLITDDARFGGKD